MKRIGISLLSTLANVAAFTLGVRSTNEEERTSWLTDPQF
jgi:hypothetical protein